MNLSKGLCIASVILFVLAAFPIDLGFNLIAVGLACFAGSHLSKDTQ